MNTAARPRLRGYIAMFVIWVAGWTSYITIGYYQVWSSTHIEAPDMGRNIGLGVLGGAVVLLVVFFGAWKLRSGPAVTQPAEASTAAVIPAADPHPAVLEIRGVGLMTDVQGQSDIWRLIKSKNDGYLSILSNDPKDYPNNPSSISDKSNIGLGIAFKSSAGEGVERWPIPVIVFGPPLTMDLHSTTVSAGFIASARQQASLAEHEFVWVESANVTNPQAQLEHLFDFFDKNPTVPMALVYGFDSMTIRSGFGGNDVPPGQHVPTQFDAMVGILVSRTDRVDRYVRPYVVKGEDTLGTDDKQYDIIKLWNFFWHVEDVIERDSDVGMPGEKLWQSQLPELWKTIENKGPGDFKHDNWLPIRWMSWQLDEFDNAPMLGYLHRPVTVSLNDSEGKPLRGAAQVTAVQAGWQTLQAQLTEGQKVSRVFYDSSNDPAWIGTAHQALGGEHGLDLGDVKEGFDSSKRIGNLGIMPVMVNLGLGTIASYEDGGASVVLNKTPTGQVGLFLVTPPTAAQKAANAGAKKLGDDPFAHRAP